MKVVNYLIKILITNIFYYNTLLRFEYALLALY